MADILTMQDLANGHLDVKALGEAANGDENTIVTTRTGNTYPSAERAINIMFRNGGLPATPYETKAKMSAKPPANPGDLAVVIDDAPNNGLYKNDGNNNWVKTTYLDAPQKLPTLIYNGNLSNYGEGVELQREILKYDSEYQARVVKTDAEDLNKLGCFYAFDLNPSQNRPFGAIVQSFEDIKTDRLFLSVLVYSESEDFTDVVPYYYLYKINKNTGLEIRAVNSNIVLNINVTAKTKLYYIDIPNLNASVSANEALDNVVVGVRSPSVNTLATGFWASANPQDAPLPVIYPASTKYPDWTDTTSKPYTKQIERDSEYLKELKADLENPLKSVKIRFLGDSITWGSGSTGISETEPRAHSLTDPRNNLDSPSYVNNFRKWVGTNYLDTATLQAVNRPDGTPSGVGYFEKEVVINPFDENSGVKFTSVKNGIEAKKKDLALRSTSPVNSLLPNFLNITPDSNMDIEFDITGDNFILVYAGQSIGSDPFVDVYLDGELHTSLDISRPFGWSKEHDVAFSYGEHHVRLRLRDATDNTLRFEGLKHRKRIQVENDGISGTWSGEWLPNSGKDLFTSVKPDDDYVFIQLGANDRGIDSNPANAHKTKDNLRVLAKAYLNQGKKVILMSSQCASRTVETGRGVNYHQGEIALVINELANELGIPYINNFAVTAKYKALGRIDEVTTDGLHPNDSGHFIIFDNIANQIINA